MGDEETRTEEIRSDYESVTTDAPELTEDPTDGEDTSGTTADSKGKEKGESVAPDTSEPEDGDEGDDTDAEKKNEPEEGKDTPPIGKKKPNKVPAKVRIRELTRDKYKLERENADLKAKLDKTSDTPPDERKEKKPEPGDFESYEKYQEALMDWKLDQRHARDAEKQAEEEEANDLKETEKVFYNRLEEFGNKNEDFFDLVINNKDLKITEDMFNAVIDSEHAAEVLYHLGKNPEETAKIAALSPIAVIREIGKIEAQFTGNTEPEPEPKKKITKAPDPITPINGTGKAEKEPGEMSNEEYRRWRQGKKG